MAELKHPLFARFFDRLSRVMEKEVGDFRQELLSGLSGRVVEVGAGNGINFSHYPPAVDEVIAIEPEPYLRGKAAEAARGAQVTVSVRPGVADALELEDASVDAAVASLVLCSVPDQAAALGELRRVIKPAASSGSSSMCARTHRARRASRVRPTAPASGRSSAEGAIARVTRLGRSAPPASRSGKGVI